MERKPGKKTCEVTVAEKVAREQMTHTIGNLVEDVPAFVCENVKTMPEFAKFFFHLLQVVFGQLAERQLKHVRHLVENLNTVKPSFARNVAYVLNEGLVPGHILFVLMHFVLFLVP